MESSSPSDLPLPISFVYDLELPKGLCLVLYLRPPHSLFFEEGRPAEIEELGLFAVVVVVLPLLTSLDLGA